MQSHLLLVDDEPFIAKALTRALRGEGYTIHVANSGAEGIGIMQDHPIDVVLSDYRMPEMNGSQFLSKVREMQPNTVRMMLSGHADMNAVISAVNDGSIHKFLTKPWSNDHIREEIRNAFEIANADSKTNPGGWLSAQSFTNALNEALVDQPLRVIVGEIRNAASMGGVLSEEDLQNVATVLAMRCGHVAVEHANLGRGLFAFAIDNNKDNQLEEIYQAMRTPVELGETTVTPDVHLGYSDSSAEQITDAEDLIHKATIALSTLDDEDPHKLGAYCAESEFNLHLRHSLERDMCRALENEEFILAVQPQVDTQTLHICGGEMLVRWQHPTHGLIAPLRFISLAERNGFIHDLGLWVLKQGLELARQIHTMNASKMRISVNISPRQLVPGMEKPWVDLLEATAKTDPELLHHLELEVTESTVMDDPESAAAVLKRLSQLGISIALDDFGTGHSSLGQLNKLPIDILKLDRSLIRDVLHDPRSRTLTTHLTSMARDLKFRVIAEGIEEQGQIEFCQTCHCDVMQGFAFHKPMTSEAFLLQVLEEQILEVHSA